MVEAFGDSMEPKIYAGDYVLVDQKSPTLNGENGLCAILEGSVVTEVLIKQVKNEEGKIVLSSLNDKYDNKVYDPQDVHIIGPIKV